MTTRKSPMFLGLAAVLILLFAAAPVVLAHGPSSTNPGTEPRGDHPEANESERDNESQRGAGHHGHDGNETDEANETSDANETARDGRHGNWTAALDAFHNSTEQARDNFQAGRTAVIDACKAAHNATSDNESVKHCVRDGLQPLREQARLDFRAAFASLRAALENLWPWHHHGA